MSSPHYITDNWLWLALSLVSLYLGSKVVKFIQHRRFYKDLPSPNHSFLLGNLKTMGEVMSRYPSDIHPQPAFTSIATEHEFDGIYYMDLYPFSPSFLFITDPALALQVQTGANFDRHKFAEDYLGGIVGTKSIFSTHGTEWHRQRSWFAPAFAMSHLLTLVPGMISETLVFKEKMTKFAVNGEVFPMLEQATKLAIDVIGRSVADVELKSQTEFSVIQHYFSKALSWTAGQTDPLYKKVFGGAMMWWYSRRLDGVLGEVIKEKFKGTRGDEGGKSILDLALKGYLKDNGGLGESKSRRMDLDKDFMKVALDNAKTFLVGGHDTTAIMVTYMFHYLSLHPSILARVRAEHDQILGPSLPSTITSLTSTPALLNSLPLTSALLKEVLRIHPIGFTVRQGLPGATVSFQGRTYPMDRGQMIAVLTSAMHRSPSHFPNPEMFDPDRWLGEKADVEGAWQPFEKGKRNCIGQQLALLEGRVIAALTVRWFDFQASYGEGEGKGGERVEGWGDRAYQVLDMDAKPKDGLPMRVRLTGRS